MHERPPADEPFGASSEWHALGPHRYRYWGTFFWLEMHRQFTGEHTAPFLDLLNGMRAVRDDIGLYVDAAGGLTITPDCRRLVATRSQDDGEALPMAVVGGGVLVRTVFTLLTNAIRLMRRRDIPIVFLREGAEKEALAWLEKRAAERKQRTLAAQPRD